MALIADWHRWDSFHRSLHWIVSCKWRRHLCPKLSHKTVWLSQCTNMWNPNIFQCRLAGWHLLVYFHWLTILTDVHSAVWLLSFQASNSSGRTCIHGNLMKQFNLQCDYNLFFLSAGQHKPREHHYEACSHLSVSLLQSKLSCFTSSNS